MYTNRRRLQWAWFTTDGSYYSRVGRRLDWRNGLTDLPRGSLQRLALTVWRSARQTDRQGGWERLVCWFVWTARLRYQVAEGWCCWGVEDGPTESSERRPAADCGYSTLTICCIQGPLQMSDCEASTRVNTHKRSVCSVPQNIIIEVKLFVSTPLAIVLFPFSRGNHILVLLYCLCAIKHCAA